MIEEMRFKPDVGKTERGFAIRGFLDGYDKECSIQQSSIATTAALWLGLDEVEIYDTNDNLVKVPGYRALGRMHLSTEQAKSIGRMLLHWAETDEIVQDPDMVVLTSDQFQQFVDCLGPASEDILDRIFPGRDEGETEEEL